MAGGPSMVFCRYYESGKSKIHSFIDAKTGVKVIGFNANALYLCCSGQEMLCGKEEHVEVDRPDDMEELCNQVMRGELFRFLQVDIHVLNELTDKFSEFCPLFVVDSIPDESIPTHMKECQTRTRRKMIHRTKKLLGVMCTAKTLLYLPMLKWYLSHGLKVTAIHKYLK